MQQSLAAHLSWLMLCVKHADNDAADVSCRVCSVEFSLLAPDEQKQNWSQNDGPYVRPIASVQLQTRHWIMRDENGEVTSEVRGEGVIGEFPILTPGRLTNISSDSHYRMCTVEFVVPTENSRLPGCS